MPDEAGVSKAFSGDAGALETTDPQKHQQSSIEGDDELQLPHEKE